MGGDEQIKDWDYKDTAIEILKGWNLIGYCEMHGVTIDNGYRSNDPEVYKKVVYSFKKKYPNEDLGLFKDKVKEVLDETAVSCPACDSILAD
ncbi:MAG: hypothetical protein LBM01_04045 [Christensenellaceae bacterium]|jgi:hypothetical protein|nr:hypothetical protein [Christensenellaceae bacterium]